MKKLILTGFLVVGIWLFASTEAMAIHKGSGDLVCGACHTMHNSQGNASLGGNTGGSLVLLRGAVTNREQIHNFCLQCHSSDGAQANNTFAPHTQSAPKVLLHSATANKWSETSFFNIIGGGGDFQYACGDVAAGAWNCMTNDGAGGFPANTALGKGHSLGATAVAPPGNVDGNIAAFTCTSCHDPHGTDNAASADINKFRNLRKIPTNSGATSITLTAGDHKSWVGGITGLFASAGNYEPVTQASGAAAPGATLTAIWPVFRGATLTGTPATDAANSNAYGGGATGISRWCSTCHDNWHEGIVTANKNANDWQRHPVDNILDEAASPNSGAGVDIFDPTNYSATTAGQVLPVASAQAASKVFYTTGTNAAPANSASDTVMCLSCHFAHGGPYNDNLRWNYTSAVTAGDQTGNGVPSTKGCQLCHNRGA